MLKKVKALEAKQNQRKKVKSAQLMESLKINDLRNTGDIDKCKEEIEKKVNKKT